MNRMNIIGRTGSRPHSPLGIVRNSANSWLFPAIDGSKNIANLNWQSKEFFFFFPPATMTWIWTNVICYFVTEKFLSGFRNLHLPLWLPAAPWISISFRWSKLHGIAYAVPSKNAFVHQANLCSSLILRWRLRKFSLSDESLPPKWLKCSIVFRMSPTWKEALQHTFQALRNNEWEQFWGGDN